MMDRVYMGDCIEIMQTLSPDSVDMLFTDLPYGTTRCKWDTPIDLLAFWPAARRVVKPNGCIALFAQTPFTQVLGASNLRQLHYEWVWEKTEPTGHLNAKRMPLKAHESILIFYDRLPTYHPQMTHGHPRKISTAYHKRGCKQSEVYGPTGLVSYDSTDRYPRSVLKGPTDKQTCNLHEGQKPVWLCEYMVQTYTAPGDIVLDCCMGSASIGVACQQTGRDYIGIDKDQYWYDVARKRLGLPAPEEGEQL